MTQKTSGQLKRISVRLWIEDLRWLKARHPENYNAKIRHIVGAYILSEKAKEADCAKKAQG